MAADPGGLAPDLEERVRRAALGEPGRLRIEVGMDEPRFGASRGRPEPESERLLRRALGGVEYPANREELLAAAGAWLTREPGLLERLATLPEGVYGSELEALAELRRSEA
ncbi:MAG: hypothetical protein ACREN4_08115 [Candidatus Dormibacteria bacterium]